MKIPLEKDKNQLLDVLLPIEKDLTNENGANKAQIEMIVCLDHAKVLPTEPIYHLDNPQ